MTAAAASRINTSAVISTVNSVCLMDFPLFLSRVSSRCPAVMSAVKRTTSVPGKVLPHCVSSTHMQQYGDI